MRHFYEYFAWNRFHKAFFFVTYKWAKEALALVWPWQAFPA
jgi:hypothetical protein